MLLSRLHGSGSLAMASVCVSGGSLPRLCSAAGNGFPKRMSQVVRVFSEAWSSPNFGSPQVRASRSFSGIRVQADEERAAAVAAATADSGAATIFDKIISKEIPSTVVYEDDKALAFRDINPQAPVHIVLIPKNRNGLTQLAKAEERHKDILGHLLYVAKIVAAQEDLADGFRVVINDGPSGCQSVYHLHLHILGGRKLKWPPG